MRQRGKAQERVTGGLRMVGESISVEEGDGAVGGRQETMRKSGICCYEW